MAEIGTGTGRAFGTFGELVQGTLPEGDRDFLVTFPVDVWATAVFHYRPAGREVCARPRTKHKARRLAQLALEELGQFGGGVLDLVNELPEGKGLASSSADLVATARAVADAFAVSFDQETIESLLRRIEPSDGVMYNGIVAFYHREVQLLHYLGALPPLAIVSHDEGGQIDTVRYNRLAKPFTDSEKHEYARLLADISAAVDAGDLREVGRISTRSATLNEKLRPRQGFQKLLHTCADVDGLGLLLAHSGTMLGILLKGDDPELSAKSDYVRSSCIPLGGDIIEYRSLSSDRIGV